MGRHRAEIKHKLTPEARKGAWLKKCEAMGEAAAIAAIDHSIANGWTGMFPPKTEDQAARPHRSAERKDPVVTDWDYKSKRMRTHEAIELIQSEGPPDYCPGWTIDDNNRQPRAEGGRMAGWESRRTSTATRVY